MLVYLSQQDKNMKKISLIDIPYWVSSLVCYQDILLYIGLRIEDYPASIGPFASPMNYVQYMDSLLQLNITFLHCICIVFHLY